MTKPLHGQQQEREKPTPLLGEIQESKSRSKQERRATSLMKILQDADKTHKPTHRLPSIAVWLKPTDSERDQLLLGGGRMPTEQQHSALELPPGPAGASANKCLASYHPSNGSDGYLGPLLPERYQPKSLQRREKTGHHKSIVEIDRCIFSRPIPIVIISSQGVS